MIDRFMAPNMASFELEFGDFEGARKYLEQVTVDEGNRESMSVVALLMAQLGEIERAQELLDKLVDEYPDTTWVHASAAPRIRAAIAMTAGRPEEAVAELMKARFERRDLALPFEKGKALLAAGKPDEALVEFQKIRAWKGIEPIDLRRAATLVWMGRAYVAAGDTDAARSAYLEFLELWVDADEDIPLLQKARAEYEALPGVRG
jgi:predicted Zn-dependent protease